MNLLILDHFNRHGGAQEYILEIGLQLKADGHRVFVPKSPVSTLRKMASDLESTGFEILGKSYKNPIFYSNFVKNIFQLKKFVKDNNITHIHCNSVPVLPLARLVSGKLPISFTAHDFLESGMKNSMIVMFADRVVAVSEAVKENLTLKGVHKPITVITNGFFPIESDVTLDESSAVAFAIVGRVERWKGVELFLKAGRKVLSDYPKATFTVYGYSEDEHYETICNKIINKHDTNMNMISFIEDKNELFDQVDVLVNASIEKEPFGRTLVEASLHHIPVIGPNMAGPKEIIEDRITGLLFNVGDSNDLAEKMKELCAEPHQREVLAKNGYLKATTTYNISKISNEFAAFIDVKP